MTWKHQSYIGKRSTNSLLGNVSVHSCITMGSWLANLNPIHVKKYANEIAVSLSINPIGL